jgi:hypothetical protein
VHPIHRTAIAVIIGLAAVVGLVGLTRTLDLGAATPAAKELSPATIAKRSQALDKVSASLRRARASRPPALPPVPSYPDVPVSSPAPPRAAPVAITYVRPPPNVVIVPRSGGERDDDEGGSEEQDD